MQAGHVLLQSGPVSAQHASVADRGHSYGSEAMHQPVRDASTYDPETGEIRDID